MEDKIGSTKVDKKGYSLLITLTVLDINERLRQVLNINVQKPRSKKLGEVRIYLVKVNSRKLVKSLWNFRILSEAIKDKKLFWLQNNAKMAKITIWSKKSVIWIFMDKKLSCKIQFLLSKPKSRLWPFKIHIVNLAYT